MDDEPLQWHNIGMLPRETEFPFRVSSVGYHNRAGGSYSGRHEGGLEFCLRLRSDAAEVVDRFDGKVYRTPYPHLVVKRPGPLHEYEEPERVEAFFFIYQPSMAPLLGLAGVDFGGPVMPIVASNRLLRVVDFARTELFPLPDARAEDPRLARRARPRRLGRRATSRRARRPSSGRSRPRRRRGAP